MEHDNKQQNYNQSTSDNDSKIDDLKCMLCP